MTKTRYHEPSPITREDAEKEFASEASDRISHALVSLALYDPDWRWVQDKCLYFIDDSRFPDVRKVAITCLGHLARIHGKLDMNKVMPVLESLRNDVEVSGVVADALEDIGAFASI